MMISHQETAPQLPPSERLKGIRREQRPAGARRSRAFREPPRFLVASAALGLVLVAATSQGVAAILIGDDREALVRDLERRFPGCFLAASDPDFAELFAAVVAFVDDSRRPPAFPLDLRGTPFQERVWRALVRIPAGTTSTYAEVARAIGSPEAVRAVAGACAANAIAVAIPCHRVLRQDGGLSGYRWGVARKRALLDKEMGR